MGTTPRFGRLKTGFGERGLPEVHVETGGNIPLPTSALPAGQSDLTWDLPNAFPMMRVDLRTRRSALTSDELPPRVPRPTASELASDIASIMIPAYIDRFAQRFAAVGKPLKYALLIVGIDSDPQSWFISRSPEDGYIWPPSGAQTGQSILIRSSGPDKSLEFFGNATGQDAFFQKLRDALDAHTPPMPYPDMLLGNIESRGDVGATGPYGLDGVNPGVFVNFPSPGRGFIEIASLSAMLTRQFSVDEWFQTRTLTQESQPLDPFAPLVTSDVSASGSANQPDNHEALVLAFNAITASFDDALSMVLYEPFREVFGDRPSGEWDVHASSQVYQPPQGPIRRQHFLGQNQLRASLQIPSNYGGLPLYSANDQIAFAANSDWPTAWHWLNAYQPAGYTPWTTYPTNVPAPPFTDERMIRLVLDVQSQVVCRARASAPNSALMPSVSFWEFSFADRAPRRPFMVRYMLNCCDQGAAMFYLFASEWNTGNALATAQDIRTSNFELIRDFNNMFHARTPWRNRMYRFGV